MMSDSDQQQHQWQQQTQVESRPQSSDTEINAQYNQNNDNDNEPSIKIQPQPSDSLSEIPSAIPVDQPIDDTTIQFHVNQNNQSVDESHADNHQNQPQDQGSEAQITSAAYAPVDSVASPSSSSHPSSASSLHHHRAPSNTSENDHGALTPLRPGSPLLRGYPLGAQRPPLPQSELDIHRNNLMGLKVFKTNQTMNPTKIDPRREGIEGKHWIREEDLPQFSTVNSERFYPFSPKRIRYELNDQNVIVWIRYL